MRASLVSMSVLAGLMGLSACATDGGGTTYQSQLAGLTETCDARGGILSPTGAQSGRPQNDYVCKITGGPSGRIQGS